MMLIVIIDVEGTGLAGAMVEPVGFLDIIVDSVTRGHRVDGLEVFELRRAFTDILTDGDGCRAWKRQECARGDFEGDVDRGVDGEL